MILHEHRNYCIHKLLPRQHPCRREIWATFLDAALVAHYVTLMSALLSLPVSRLVELLKVFIESAPIDTWVYMLKKHPCSECCSKIEKLGT